MLIYNRRIIPITFSCYVLAFLFFSFSYSDFVLLKNLPCSYFGSLGRRFGNRVSDTILILGTLGLRQSISNVEGEKRNAEASGRS